MKKANFGFTLAEVLITLGIIGVVAAITIPGLITNFKKRETVAKVKVAYSIFSQAVKLSVNENEDPSGWTANTSKEYAEIYITPYLTGLTKTTVSPQAANPMRTLSSQGDAATNRYHDWSWNSSEYPVYTLQNGMSFVISAGANDGYPTIVVDINGPTGKPNIMGIDGFAFWIKSNDGGSVTPAGATHTVEQLTGKKSAPVRACIRDDSWQYYRGGYCAALLQKNNWNMPKDYPWGNGNLTQAN